MIILRKYQHHDKCSLIQLWQEAFANPAPHNEPNLVLAKKLKVDNLLFVAEKKGVIVGSCMAGYDGHRGWLYSVAISKQTRRMGIGSKLVKHTIRELNKIGCTKVNLQIVAGNEQVTAFYQSLGFTIEKRISMGQFIKKREH
ncbi:GNAT family acetyltransferase [Psychromonas hadalis]|uniref:GNAT family acetyltransferase n=1 Tax=Psychromonas hadalis TaxID=211669 RepID=UPI0003B76B20|nr:GNAT family acetyltransferase [Psychromonas hadalis]